MSVLKSRNSSEKIIEKRLFTEVKNVGGLCIKLVTIHFLGLPDRLVLLPKGILFFVELKSTGKKPQPIQLAVHKLLRELGFKVYVIDNIEDVDLLLDTYTEAIKNYK